MKIVFMKNTNPWPPSDDSELLFCLGKKNNVWFGRNHCTYEDNNKLSGNIYCYFPWSHVVSWDMSLTCLSLLNVDSKIRPPLTLNKMLWLPFLKIFTQLSFIFFRTANSLRNDFSEHLSMYGCFPVSEHDQNAKNDPKFLCPM